MLTVLWHTVIIIFIVTFDAVISYINVDAALDIFSEEDMPAGDGLQLCCRGYRWAGAGSVYTG